ncbi:Rv1733c family protein [Streptomyces hydrogenans]|uniref:Rv1733c family protein n=1 Tax=Streptomyces hydrogenans TaxID=1873719 RepID=UPI0035DAD083
MIVVLTLALICGAVAAGYLWSFGARADRIRAAHQHQVVATTTGPAREQAALARSGVESPALAPAVWEYPDGVSRSGTVEVPARTPQGRTVTVSVDDKGAPVRPIDGTSGRLLTSVAGGTATAAAVAATGTGALVLLRRRIDGRTLAALEREWEQVEPVWSGRLRRESGPDGGPGKDDA